MMQVIRMPMGSHLFLNHKEADWVKTQPELGIINVPKSIIPLSLLMTCYH